MTKHTPFSVRWRLLCYFSGEKARCISIAFSILSYRNVSPIRNHAGAFGWVF